MWKKLFDFLKKSNCLALKLWKRQRTCGRTIIYMLGHITSLSFLRERCFYKSRGRTRIFRMGINGRNLGPVRTTNGLTE
jgi:hypothetical protein